MILGFGVSAMERREFITILGGAAAAWPLAAVHAQQGERMRRIGILMPYLPTNAEMQARVRAFREELRKRGWAASVNAQFDERWTSDNMDLVRSAAAGLVELNPDVIMASGARLFRS
jgi:putative tryptophan/tyrosine transport system substrate-binding protein